MLRKITNKIILIFLIVCLTSVSSSAAADLGWVYGNNGKIENIRSVAGLKATSYNVIQGSCSDDNKMFYFAFMDKNSEHIIIVKMRYENNRFKFIKKSKAFSTYHGNDMAYINDFGDISGNDKILITNTHDGLTNHITVFDVATMKPEDSEIVCRYWKNYDGCVLYKKGKLCEDQLELDSLIYEKHGFSGIAYDKVNKRLVVCLASKHDLMTFNIEYKEDNIILTPTSYIVQARTESTMQGIDCDSKYIYACWSPASNVCSVNRIYKYNWQGKRLKKYDINKSYELESLAHINIQGTSQFFASYHHSYLHYYTISKKVKLKKKVWNKAHTKKVYKYKTIKTKHCETRRNAYIKNLAL